MKRRSLAIICLLLVFATLLSACGEYKDAVEKPEHTVAPTVTDPSSGEEIKNPFTVTLSYQGQTYIPTAENPIDVQWNDGYSVHTAPLGPDGIARIGGLDGDYKVTISSLPEGFTYNPNIYNATNNSRHVEIELHKIVPTQGRGMDLYSAIPIKFTGVYCVEVKSADLETYFEFAPTKSGTYGVQSWMDVTADEINPMANYYGANAAYKRLISTHDDGGPEGSYTKNFVMDVQIAEENISKNGTGAAAFTFGIKATQKSGKYPIKVYIAITLDGEFSLDHVDGKIMVPEFDFEAAQEYDKDHKGIYGASTEAHEYDDRYTFVGAEFKQTTNGNSANVFDGDRYKLYPIEEGGDGYYHLYDESKYSRNKGYGPILYAKISAPCRFLSDAFTTLEYHGNKALTLSNGAENYKLFIEGYSYLASMGSDPVFGKQPYFCDRYCPCRLEGTCDSVAITGEVGACTEGCEKCLITCNHCPKEGIGHKGYAGYTNSDGCCPVTQELKDFLQKYSISQLLFMDGQGFVETHETYQVFAAEEDQWLFACGYYKEK